MKKVPKTCWIADLETMTCRNTNTNIVVIFEKEKNVFLPRFKDIPAGISEKWAKMEDVEKEKEKIMEEAEDAFMNAFIEKDVN